MTVSSSNIKSNITKLKNKVLSINKDEIFCSQALDELYGLVERLNNLDLNSHKSKEILLSQSFANRFITKLNKNLNLETITNNSLLKDILMANYIVKSTYQTIIREDYAYKYSSAMAFEGYKKQTQEISPDLQKKLLEIAIVNLGDNPIRLYNNKVKHTPIDYEKIIEELKLFSKDKLDDSLK